jgi:hypothetical protein
MEKEGISHIPPSPPDIVVQSLTEPNIMKALKNFASDDAYWLKLFLAGHGSDYFDIEAMNKIIGRITS